MRPRLRTIANRGGRQGFGAAAPRGAAIECRINAEDPEHDFRPATGTVLHLNVPGGPGVRFDSHLARGAEVTPWYDGLLGKLICYGANREQARGRLVNALGEFALLGVTNNAAYVRDIIASEQFRDAKLSTHFIDEFFSAWKLSAAEIDAAVGRRCPRRRRSASRGHVAAKQQCASFTVGRPEQLRAVEIAAMKLVRAGDSREIDVEVISRDGAIVRIRIGDRELAAEFTPNTDGGGVLAIDGRRYPIFSARGKTQSSFRSAPRLSSSSRSKPFRAAAREGSQRLKSPRRCPARCSRSSCATATWSRRDSRWS